MYWNDWPFQRIVFLFTGIAFLMMFIQVTLFHYRQNFRHWSMWIPVLATPLFGLLLLFLTAYNAPWLRVTLAVLLGVGSAAGVYGSYQHMSGVGERVGGYELRNFLTGPPVMLPGIITALSLLGIAAIYWGE
ncbi:hypothetical protein [Aneurinibacillus tyrosinisolvens]|uniref:hypothetical protein n=1 Tax=Aneurinibacillus tyrosinisolvens TaxID=1443435 RepID=UPI00063F48B2|nr:hypothetical protein [Aneurinibacillus tyrosinisolvens]